MFNTEIRDRAVLISLSISIWTANKKDREASKELTDSKRASANAARVQKTLVARDSLHPVRRAANSIRSHYYSRSLPWLDDGSRILPSAIMDEFMSQHKQLERQFNEAVDAFCDHWDAHVKAARAALGDLFDPADYPTASAIHKAFESKLAVRPIPSGDDFRVDLPDHIASTLRKQVDSDVQSQAARTAETCSQRMYDALSKVVDRLSGDDAKIFRDSMIGNLRELAAIMPALNITDDPKLAEAARQIEAKLASLNPDDIRKNDEVRKQAAADAGTILDGLMSPVE